MNSLEDLNSVIENRHIKCADTAEYKAAESKLNSVYSKLEKLPGGRSILLQLEEAVNELQGLCFDAAYRDGMSDLMAAMALNKSGIIAAAENYSVLDTTTA